MARTFRAGERVDGLYDANADDVWYPARVLAVSGSEEADGGRRYELRYDDGEVEARVPAECVRRHVVGTVSVGTRVLGRYAGGDELYPGRITEVQEDGRYTIEYDDSEVEADVPIEYISEPPEPEIQGNVEENPARDELDENENEPQQQDDQQQLVDTADQERQSPPPPSRDPQDSAHDSESPSTPHKRIAFEYSDPEPAAAPVAAEISSDTTSAAVESLELLRTRLADAGTVKTSLSTLVKQMRAFPQDTAQAVHARGGERLLLDALATHSEHAVVQCYAFVLLRRLCFLSPNSIRELLAAQDREGAIARITNSMRMFPTDAILQAAACGALAVFTRDQAGVAALIAQHSALVVLASLKTHQTYSVHTRQVHYYGSEGPRHDFAKLFVYYLQLANLC